MTRISTIRHQIQAGTLKQANPTFIIGVVGDHSFNY